MKTSFAAVLALMLCIALPGFAMAEVASAAAAANVQSTAKGRIGIAAIVNEDIITFSDINNRLALLITSEPPENVRKELEFKTLAKLIDEKLELQEAKSLGITVTEDQIQGGFANIAAQNNMSPEDFKKRLSESNLQVDTIYDQIRAEMAWNQVARRQLRPQINISESEIDSELQAIKNAAAAPAPAPVAPAADGPGGKYVHLKQLVILFGEKDPASVINAKVARAVALKNEIKGCDQMDKKMQEFKNRGTADLGMGPLDGLPPPLKNAVENLPIGEPSNPVRGQNGVAILMVCERSDNGPPAPAPAAAPGSLPTSAQLETMTPEQQRDAVANSLGLKRMMQMQERYLRDLRATAFIDKRI